MAIKVLPEGNGWYSNWRMPPAPIWMKPGFIKVQDGHKYGVRDYNPLRWNTQVPPTLANANQPGYSGNSFRLLTDNPNWLKGPTTMPVDFYHDRIDPDLPSAGYIGAPYALQRDPGKRSWANEGYPKVTGANGAGGVGAGMTSSLVQRTPDYSYHTGSITTSPYLANQTYCTVTNNGAIGYGGTTQFTFSPVYLFYPQMMNSPFVVSYFSKSRGSAYRVRARVKAATQAITVAIVLDSTTPLITSNSVTLTPGDPNWYELDLTFRGSDLSTLNLGYYVFIRNTGNLFASGPSASPGMYVSDIRFEDLSVPDNAVFSSWTPTAFAATRSDSTSGSQYCFPTLYSSYGCSQSGTGDVDSAWRIIHGRNTGTYDCGTGYGVGTSKTYDYMDRSYSGYNDPRVLSRPFGSGFSYNRYMTVHPFCPGFGWYWTFHVDCGQSVGYGYCDWTDVTGIDNWELVMPTSIEPAFDKEYTWIHRAYNPTGSPAMVDPSNGAWRTIDFDGAATITNSKFTLEIASSWASYANNGGPAGCYSFAPPPPIPSGTFALYLLDWNDYNLVWPDTIPGTKIMDITAVWSGAQNAAWTLTNVTFSAGVDSTYTLNTATDLGMPVNETIWGAVLSIKPQDIPSGKAAFYLIEEYAESPTRPWFMTPWNYYTSGGPGSGGFGSSSDTTGNYYNNSLSVAIQPYLEVQLPRWRYAIPWGATPEDTGEDPPLRMVQRDDGVGNYQGHPRLRYTESPKHSSTHGTRIMGDNSYR